MQKIFMLSCDKMPNHYYLVDTAEEALEEFFAPIELDGKVVEPVKSKELENYLRANIKAEELTMELLVKSVKWIQPETCFMVTKDSGF